MVKRNTIEVDDAEDLVDDDLVDDNLVDEELEILLRVKLFKNLSAVESNFPISMEVITCSNNWKILKLHVLSYKSIFVFFVLPAKLVYH